MHVRPVTFAGASIAVEYSGERCARIVEFVFSDIPDEPPGEPEVEFQLVETSAGALRLTAEGELLCEDDSDDLVAFMLVGHIGNRLAETSSAGVVLHAAAVRGPERGSDAGLVLPGLQGAGKTTLTLLLATAGLHYLTDEFVFVPEGSCHLEPFRRPLNLKVATRELVSQRLDLEERPELRMSSTDFDLISPRVFADSAPRQAELRLIIFPRYSTGARFELEKMSGAEAGFALMDCLVNARQLSERGFRELARLGRSVPAYSLDYGGTEGTKNALETIPRLLAAVGSA